MSDTDRLLTTKEVAERLHHAEAQISRMCLEGRFPGAFRSGQRRGVWRIPQSGLDAYIAKQQAACAPTRAGGAA